MKSLLPQKTITALALLGLCATAFAEPEVKVSGQIRERSTYSTKGSGFNAEFGEGNDKHELRSRIAVDAKTSDMLSLRVEIQDSRTFGSEPAAVAGVPHTSTIGNAKGVDLHQAYFVLGDKELSMKLGRQKVKLGSQRMVSSLEWHPNARVFDGLRIDKMLGKGKLTGLALMSNDAGKDTYTSLSGLFYSGKVPDLVNYDVYTFYDKNTQAAAGLQNWDLLYFGEKAKFTFGDTFFEEEFIYQGGEVRGGTSMSSSAFYLATRLGFKMNKNVFSIGYDVMSGDDGSDDTFNVYMNNYTFAHAYFGWMDYFVVNKAHTGGSGVQDIRLDAKLAVSEKSTLILAGHYFMPHAGDGDAYGTEFDAELHGKWFPKSKFVFGASMFLPNADRFEDGSPEFSFYFMPIVNF
jgi:hypothetical protein